VIAAILPMAFVSGMMGPYMSPMPIGASIAMIISLIIALTLTPYLGYMFLRGKEKSGKEHKPTPLNESPIFKLYSWTISPMIEKRRLRWVFVITTFLILLISVSLFMTKSVAVKMLPFDNKNEFQVVVDMPEGTSLERTAAVTGEIAAYIARQPMITSYQGYVGTSGPMSFNGLVRHYDMRRGGNVADIQVNLIDKAERSLQSHEIAKSMRAGIQDIGRIRPSNNGRRIRKAYGTLHFSGRILA
jgi:multidrug efflux pump subunit AcrB